MSQRQWQPAERTRELLCGVALAGAASSADQILGAGDVIEDVDGEHPCVLVKASVAGGDQDVPVPVARRASLVLPRPRKVVQHQ